MAKVLVVTSGKGGVGKTTSTAALGAALAQMGQRVVVIDFDVGLRNLDLVLGAERRVVFDLINVVQGVAKLQQALIRDKRLENLWLLPASQTRDKDALTEEGVSRIIAELRTRFDWILCDSPAGIERGAMLAMRYADAAVIVTNPEVSSVRDSDRIIGMLDSKTVKAERGEMVEKHILITRYDPGRASSAARSSSPSACRGRAATVRAQASNASGGRFAAMSTQTAPSAAAFFRVAGEITRRSARAIRSSPAPCCQSAWLEIIQVFVPQANASASTKLHRLPSRRKTTYIRTLASAARSEADNFSIISATRSTSGCCHPCLLR